MRLSPLMACFLLGACGTSTPVTDSATDAGTTDSGETDETTDPLKGACGEVTRETVTVRGAVEYANDGGPAAGVDVWLEERTWSAQGQGEWGRSTTTDANGRFEFQATDVVAPVGNCWNIVSYFLMAEQDKLAASEGVTQSVFNAVAYDGVADLSLLPLILQ